MIAIVKALEGHDYSSVLSATAGYPLELIWAISVNYITNVEAECSGAFGAI
jgi:hypothetical protein